MELRKSAMKALFWNDQSQQWHDFDMSTGKQNSAIFPSNFLPLWCGAYDDNYFIFSPTDSDAKTHSFKDNMVKVLLNSGLVQPGGTLTSLQATEQQWDNPNAWAPLQSLLIDALRDMNTPNSLQFAESMALNWIKANYIGYTQTGVMHEKYNAFIPGAPGNGGEYDPQVGFGWTNGVVLDLLNIYGGVATLESENKS